MTLIYKKISNNKGIKIKRKNKPYMENQVMFQKHYI